MEQGHPHGMSGEKLFHKISLREMTEAEIEKLMLDATDGRLATVGEDGPYIVPLAFVFHNKHVYFHCHKEGKKLINIARDPRVCFQTDISSADTLNYRSVIIQGTAKQITDEKELVDSMTAMMEKYKSPMKGMLKNPGAVAKLIRVFKVADYRMSSKFSEGK